MASGKTLKSRENILKGIFLAEYVEYTINVWIIDHSYGTNWRMRLRHAKVVFELPEEKISSIENFGEK